jgi:hypothetical protein
MAGGTCASSPEFSTEAVDAEDDLLRRQLLGRDARAGWQRDK